MLILISIIIGLGIVVALGTRLFSKNGSDDDAVTQPRGDCATCSGSDERCAHDCMMEAAVKDIEYYDDEELDAYRGRPSDAYTDDEAECFRDVMLTMREDEVAGWARSLALRGISPPDQIKDEMIMLINEEPLRE